jgi:DNA modification methylase
MKITENIEIYKGDCLELMKLIPNGSIDAIITDPPYGTTACKWDSVIPFDLMWEQLNRIIKPNGAIVLFGSEPFSSALRMSNIKNYKYDWVWDKIQPSNFLNAKKQPLRQHEIVSVFYKKQSVYNRQFTERPIKDQRPNAIKNKINQKNQNGQEHTGHHVMGYSKDYDYTKVNPKSILSFTRQPTREKLQHPTQKPVELMEYLIKTYTNENETVLDFTMGSGSTGVACVNTKRKFLGIEQDDKYFEIAKERINNAIGQTKLF